MRYPAFLLTHSLTTLFYTYTTNLLNNKPLFHDPTRLSILALLHVPLGRLFIAAYSCHCT